MNNVWLVVLIVILSILAIFGVLMLAAIFSDWHNFKTSLKKGMDDAYDEALAESIKKAQKEQEDLKKKRENK